MIRPAATSWAQTRCQRSARPKAIAHGQVLAEDVLALLEPQLVRLGRGQVRPEPDQLIRHRPAGRVALPLRPLADPDPDGNDHRHHRDRDARPPGRDHPSPRAIAVPARPAPNTQNPTIAMQAQRAPLAKLEPPPARGIRRYHCALLDLLPQRRDHRVVRLAHRGVTGRPRARRMISEPGCNDGNSPCISTCSCGAVATAGFSSTAFCSVAGVVDPDARRGPPGRSASPRSRWCSPSRRSADHPRRPGSAAARTRPGSGPRSGRP